jgi:hypothetical protein
VLGCEEGKVMGNGLVECAAREICRLFGLNFEFQAALLQNFYNGVSSKLEILLMSIRLFLAWAR